MIEELKAKIDEYVKDTCLYYRSTHEDMLPNQFEKYLRKACIYFATESTDALQKEYRDNLSLKDEELMCLKTEFNTYKADAKEIIREYLKATESWNYDFADVLKCNKKAEAFLKED